MTGKGAGHRSLPVPDSVSDALERRNSVRAFLPRDVSRPLVEDVLRRAARAPSGGNLQPWHVRLVDGEEMVRLKAFMDRRIVEVPDGEAMPFHFYPAEMTADQTRRRQRNGDLLYGALGIARSDAEARRAWNLENFRFFGAPVGVMLFLDDAATPFQWLDVGVYLQSVLLLLQEAGLASCPQADWALYGQSVGRFLGMADGLTLVCGIAIGHADPDRPENHIRTERDDPLAEAGGAAIA